ncbi:MAG: 16S rRNA (cytosine(1402)-N(4))-methyltransferase RsmH [Candidatus Gracilibacteria bacterium]
MKHVPVLREEVQNYLNLSGGEVVVDATLGLGGHASDLVQKIGAKGVLIAFDQDSRNLEKAKENLKAYTKRIHFIHDNFRHLKTRVTEEGFTEVDAILFDLGLSSPHVDEASRGFSFLNEGPLDMRYDQRSKLTAYEVINSYAEDALAKVFYEYAEDRSSRKIARQICNQRKIKPFETTTEFADFLNNILPKKQFRRHGKLNPATKYFQAIRIEVNDELGALKDALKQTMEILKVGGRVVFISYHSLEDGIVKHFFKELERPAASPEESVYQTFGEAIVEALTKKPVTPGEAELAENPRSRSAKLRAYKKLKLIPKIGIS